MHYHAIRGSRVNRQFMDPRLSCSFGSHVSTPFMDPVLTCRFGSVWTSVYGSRVKIPSMNLMLTCNLRIPCYHAINESMLSRHWWILCSHAVHGPSVIIPFTDPVVACCLWLFVNMPCLESLQQEFLCAYNILHNFCITLGNVIKTIVFISL